MQKKIQPLFASATALTLLLLSTPVHSAPPVAKAQTASSPVGVKAPETLEEKGRALYLGIFFNTGKYAGKLPELHTTNAKLFIQRDARIKRDPRSLRKLADYLDSRGEAVRAEQTRLAADVLAGNSGSRGKLLSAERTRALLLDAIAQEEPRFFARFAKAVTSGKLTEVDRALTDAGDVTAKGIAKLKRDGHNLGDISLAPQEGTVVVVALVIVVLVNVVVTIDLKDTPDKVAPPCTGDDCGCQGGGDCGFRLPRGYLERTQLAKFTAERFAGA